MYWKVVHLCQLNVILTFTVKIVGGIVVGLWWRVGLKWWRVAIW